MYSTSWLHSAYLWLLRIQCVIGSVWFWEWTAGARLQMINQFFFLNTHAVFCEVATDYSYCISLKIMLQKVTRFWEFVSSGITQCHWVSPDVSEDRSASIFKSLEDKITTILRNVWKNDVITSSHTRLKGSYGTRKFSVRGPEAVYWKSHFSALSCNSKCFQKS